MTATAIPLSDGEMQYVVDGRLIPLQFPYLGVLLQGRPRHGEDAFSLRHPRMERGKRAKLFAPYDALDGYSEHIRQKNIPYAGRRFPDEEETEETNRRLLLLRAMTANSRLARRSRPAVTATYYVPCADGHHGACGRLGQYKTVTGAVRRVDPVRRILLVEDTAIPWDDLLSVESETLFGGGE